MINFRNVLNYLFCAWVSQWWTPASPEKVRTRRWRRSRPSLRGASKNSLKLHRHPLEDSKACFEAFLLNWPNTHSNRPLLIFLCSTINCWPCHNTFLVGECLEMCYTSYHSLALNKEVAVLSPTLLRWSTRRCPMLMSSIFPLPWCFKATHSTVKRINTYFLSRLTF